MTELSKRGGRPKKEADERKGYALSFRARDKMRERLQVAAEGTGRSVSEEIEARLERSFLVDEGLGGGHRAALARLVAANVQLAEEATGTSFTESALVREICAAAVQGAMRHYVNPPRLSTGLASLTHSDLMKSRLRQRYATLAGEFISSFTANHDPYWALVMGLTKGATHKDTLSTDALIEIIRNSVKEAEDKLRAEVEQAKTWLSPSPSPSSVPAFHTLLELMTWLQTARGPDEQNDAVTRFKQSLEVRAQSGDPQALEDAARLELMEQTGKPLVEAWEDQKDRSVTEAFDAQHSPKAAGKPREKA